MGDRLTQGRTGWRGWRQGGWVAMSLIGLGGPVVGAVDFDHEVAPLLKSRCLECHGPAKKKGGLNMNDRAGLLTGSENGPVVTAGDASKSRLLEVITSEDPDERMPPKGDRLSSEQIGVLRRWIDEGAGWPEEFAFERPAYEPPLKPRRPELPPPQDGRNHPVDRLIDAYLASKNLPRPEPADDATFLRRVSLDLTGLLPSPEATEDFLADASPDKRTAVIESLLADERDYADHWLTFWNDLLRNDFAGTGYIDGGRRQISAWLYSALQNNMPYDQFARELIAPPTDESRGFIGGIKWRGEVSAGQTVEIQFAQSVAQTFLGLNMKCASCHDSFVDRWKLDEAYGLAAIFSERDLEIARCDKGTGRSARAAWIFPELGQVDPQAPQPERLKQLAALMTHRENGRFTRTIVNRLWHRLMGRGIVHPVDAMQSEPWHPDLLDALAEHLVDNGYDLKRTLALIATSHAYQSRTVAPATPSEDAAVPFAGPRAKRLTAEQFVDAIWQLTGTAPAKMDAPVNRISRNPRTGEPASPAPAASWIWGESARDGAAPPAGETITLQKHFTIPRTLKRAVAGVTCDNEFRLFINGTEVARSENWETMTGADITSAVRPGENTVVVEAKNAGSGPNFAGLFLQAHFEFDDGSTQDLLSDGSWTWHPGPRATPGTPQPAIVVPPLQAWSQVVAAQLPDLLTRGPGSGGSMVRASLMNSDLLMRALGRPNREQIVSMRPNDLTTLEAIDLSNGQILAGLLARGAEKLAARPWPDVAALVRHLFLSALCRPPSENELALLAPSLDAPLTPQAVEDALWAVCMTPEFQLVR